MKTLCLLFALVSVASAEPRLERYVLLLSDPPVAKQVRMGRGIRTAEAVTRHSTASGQTACAEIHVEGAGRPRDRSGEHDRKCDIRGGRPEPIGFTEGAAGSGAGGSRYPPKRHLNKALDLMDVPAAWTALGGSGSAGTGTRIAILDTGFVRRHTLRFRTRPSRRLRDSPSAIRRPGNVTLRITR